MKHSSDTILVENKMKATFQYRQKVVQDPGTASTVLDLFPRFLDTPGLVGPSMETFLKETGPKQPVSSRCRRKKQQHPGFLHHPGPEGHSLQEADPSCCL